ncbi:MAG: hypothetical protein HGA79_08640 [Anaerolineales bacterium]|nr:hypothetical protein [Anaerolineales bacterium]
MTKTFLTCMGVGVMLGAAGLAMVGIASSPGSYLAVVAGFVIATIGLCDGRKKSTLNDWHHAGRTTTTMN